MTALEQSREWLSALGIADINETILTLCVEKTRQHILNFCHIREIPEELVFVWTEMACGEYLLTLKSTGKLEGLDLTPIEKQVQLGDMNVTLSGETSPEQRLNTLLSHLMDHNHELEGFRCIQW